MSYLLHKLGGDHFIGYNQAHLIATQPLRGVVIPACFRHACRQALAEPGYGMAGILRSDQPSAWMPDTLRGSGMTVDQ